ncbi:hypothetical protein P4555_07740 [Peribacillus frigoritolerans]|uniref:hypothetical protein n=1 Tax=Peribacillus frigoritolerans TaxID=450367 RepID=UPI002E21939D|nr:hypothetical protein [Peribacillus frigoritolerans]
MQHLAIQILMWICSNQKGNEVHKSGQEGNRNTRGNQLQRRNVNRNPGVRTFYWFRREYEDLKAPVIESLEFLLLLREKNEVKVQKEDVDRFISFLSAVFATINIGK